MNIHKIISVSFLSLVGILVSVHIVTAAVGSTTVDSFIASPPLHVLSSTSANPQGLTPTDIKTAYNLPKSGGKGTIALITVFHHPAIESDLDVFDRHFSLASCTTKNKCLEVHSLSQIQKEDAGWSLESALDSEWAHAIAPSAKILVVEAASEKAADLLKAVDYARSRTDVVSVGMSWGGDEFPEEATLDKHFTNATSSSNSRALAFFASSGDDGKGVSWPAISPNVIAVGGTSLTMASGKFVSEKAWSGSGGGISAYETEPVYQSNYSIPQAKNKRAIPDIAFAADPAHGFSVFHSSKWYVVGGTSAGAPQWAAIATLGKNSSSPIPLLAKLYQDKAAANQASFFRDITSGKNGSCVYYCQARSRYDYVTGLGSPLTSNF